MAHFRAFMALAGLSALAACVSVLPEQKVPTALYRLGEIPASTALEANIVVREPMAERILGGQNMVAQGEDGGLRLIEDVEWAGRLTRLMQTGLIDALSGPGEGIALTELSGALGQYELSWRIKDLTLVTETGGNVRALCTLELTVMEGRTREPITHGSARAEAPLAGRTPSRKAQALSQAARGCLADAAQFLSETVNTAYSPASGS
ncbi:MAG: PqiC family protein [Hyphomonadaceae bacterium]|nr:PqiC family protein [Hyphomonadaceae bacterium]